MSSFYNVFLDRCEQGGLLYNGIVTDEQLKIVEHSGFFLNEVGEENFKKVADDLHYELCVYNSKHDRKISEVIPLTAKNAKKRILDRREKDVKRVTRFIKFIEEFKESTLRNHADSIEKYGLHEHTDSIEKHGLHKYADSIAIDGLLEHTKKFLELVGDEERSRYLKTPAQNKNGLKALMTKIITTYDLKNYKSDAKLLIDKIPLK